ncbi:MAG: alpha/beta hydrolase [Minwuia sp.]|nr:alpha/beta hydrolase [Minwuia sp.]
MARLEIEPGESLYFEYAAPGDGQQTFVFINALTGNTGTWQDKIGPALRDLGYGTLCYNFRGQAETEFADDTPLPPTLVGEDLARLMAHVAPPDPILVGLSIGGLFAAEAILAGVEAKGLVLINTLRRPGPRIEWLGTAMVAMARQGGSRLMMEANLPMLVNPDQLVAMRPTMFPGTPYEPMSPDDGLFRLMAASVDTNWDFPWADLSLPTLVMTGLHDRVFRIEQDVVELTAMIPNATTVTVEDAGHLIPVERPEAFTRHLVDFATSIQT